jgi:hypothetical protein
MGGFHINHSDGSFEHVSSNGAGGFTHYGNDGISSSTPDGMGGFNTMQSDGSFTHTVSDGVGGFSNFFTD